MHKYMYINKYIYVCICIFTCVYIHTRTHTHTNTLVTHAYIYIFTEVARDDDEVFPDFVLDRSQHICSVQLLVQRDDFDRDGGAALLRGGIGRA